MKYQISIIITLLASVTGFAQSEYFTILDQKNSIEFTHDNGDSERYFYPEIVGSGVAMLDYDNDGDLDIYLIQSGQFTANKKSDKLFKNMLIETKKLKFLDVSDEMKIQSDQYGIGIATSDFNHDGWQDFYLTNLKENQLFINQKGNGFKEVLSAENTWSTSASFCDINNDGFQDLYVSNYVNWSQENNPKCFNASSKRDYCGPDSFEGLKDSFYINDQGKNLIEQTTKYFPKMPKMPGLNVVCMDVNNDGWNDFIVANDGKANLLWLNQEGRSFKEAGLFSGLAVNAQGVAEASMGMAIADYDLDGDMDVFFTHLMNESNTLYRNNGKGYFQDVTNRSKLSRDSFAYTGWAAGFLLVNDDIYLDLVVFNGAVADASNKDSEMSTLMQSNQLYLNSKEAQFSTIKNESWLLQKAISRGAAFGDIDNDGDVDIVVNNNNGKAELLLNNQNPDEWLGITIKQKKYQNINIELSSATKKMQIYRQTDGAYASAHDNRLVLNQAQLEYFDKITISINKKTVLEQPLISSHKYITLEIK
ncbi:MAG: VCBS repeat-containing protein [Alcanivoracaceae bacterium]|nr:VCBS repeat-containing protein [Alcanivoracaceae bacterium]